MPLPVDPRLETERLLIRRSRAGDLPGLLRVHGDDEVTRYVPFDTWQSLADGEAWLARMDARVEAGNAAVYTLVERREAEPIGTALLFGLNERDGSAEIGYTLGRAQWGRGYMLEAIDALVDLMFGNVGLRRLEASVDGDNTPSLKLLTRAGFVREGLLRQRWLQKGRLADCVVFGLLKSDRTG